jgi:type II secretory pathway component PulF
MSLMEPMVILFLGVVIGGHRRRCISPIFKLGSVIQ